jgi:hypothetical protein
MAMRDSPILSLIKISFFILKLQRFTNYGLLLFWIGDEGKEAVGPSAEEEFYRTNEFNLLKDENFL